MILKITDSICIDQMTDWATSALTTEMGYCPYRS
jgi:hypothetical protein